MYLISVVLLTLVLPAGSVLVAQSSLHNAVPVMVLVGTWFAFWAGGVRLFIAGLRQMIQPRFTSETIFGIGSDDPLPFVQELGMANVAMGTLGIAAGFVPVFVLPAAIVGGLYYALAGVRHAMRRGRTANETVAMVSDLFVGVVLLAYVCWAIASYGGM